MLHFKMKMYSNFDITLNDTCKYQIQNTEVYKVHCLHAGLNGSTYPKQSSGGQTPSNKNT